MAPRRPVDFHLGRNKGQQASKGRQLVISHSYNAAPALSLPHTPVNATGTTYERGVHIFTSYNSTDTESGPNSPTLCLDYPQRSQYYYCSKNDTSKWLFTLSYPLRTRWVSPIHPAKRTDQHSTLRRTLDFVQPIMYQHRRRLRHHGQPTSLPAAALGHHVSLRPFTRFYVSDFIGCAHCTRLCIGCALCTTPSPGLRA